MPSKKRGGLSKPEYARAQAAKAKVAPKPAAKQSFSKDQFSSQLGAANSWANRPNVAAPLSGAGPLQPGQQRVPNSYTGGTQREQASKAQKRQSTPKSSAIGQRTDGSLIYSPGSLTDTGAIGQNQDGSLIMPKRNGSTQGNGGGFFSDLFSRIGQGAVRNGELAGGGNIRSSDELAQNRQDLKDYSIGIPGANASFQDMGGIQNFTPSDQPFSPPGAIGQNQDGSFIFGDTGRVLGDSTDTPFSSVNDTAQSAENRFNRQNPGSNNRNNNNFDPSFMGNGEGDANDPYYQNPANFPAFPNTPDNGNNQVSPPPYDQAPGKVTNQMRGSGLFGTGKGVGNPAGDDSYIKELRKAYSSNGGEKWLRQQFEELIKALDPTYAQMQTEGTNALNENLRNQNNQLASVMNAGNVGDSEQRAQMMAQQQSGTQTAIGALLAKLAQGKASDTSQYRSQMAQGIGQLKDKNQTNQQRLMEQIQQYRNQQQTNANTKWDQDYKMKELNQKGNTTKSPKNMSLKAIGFDKFGTENMWVDQSTGDIYDNSDFQQ